MQYVAGRKSLTNPPQSSLAAVSRWHRCAIHVMRSQNLRRDAQAQRVRLEVVLRLRDLTGTVGEALVARQLQPLGAHQEPDILREEAHQFLSNLRKQRRKLGREARSSQYVALSFLAYCFDYCHRNICSLRYESMSRAFNVCVNGGNTMLTF